MNPDRNNGRVRIHGVVVPLMASAWSPAMGQQTLATVEVRAASEQSLVIACHDPGRPSLKAVERLLGISSQTAGFRTRLMAAAADACRAGEPRIRVIHDIDGASLKWEAVP